ncbi:Fic family protein [Candidatus Woesearchaeota archaeon]|nr:Fic family protein [Candidatus Woesearchaeota archaeon]
MINLDVLPLEIIEIINSYDFIKKYLEGKLSKEDFRENLVKHGPEFKSRGITKEQILNLYEVDDPDDFHRKASYSRFCRFARRIGLDIATKQQKIDFLKSIDADKLFDILSVSNGLLRDTFSFNRWRARREEKVIVTSRVMGTPIEPPDNSSDEFRKLFYMMRQSLSIKNIDRWAVKIYMGIIFSHMFPDANGRLARNAYFIFRSNGLLDEEKSRKRTREVLKVAEFVNLNTILELLKKDGVKLSKDNYWWWAADEDYEGEGDVFVDRGYTQQLKFIAARRVLIKFGRYNGENYLGINKKCMSDEELDNYKDEYQKIRLRWFWICISVADKNYKQLMELLDNVIIK